MNKNEIYDDDFHFDDIDQFCDLELHTLLSKAYDKEVEILEIPDLEEDVDILDDDFFDEIEILEIPNLEEDIDILNDDFFNEIEILEFDDDNKNKKRKKSPKKMRLISLLIVMLLCLLGSIYKIVKWQLDNNSIHKQITSIQSITTINEIEDNTNTKLIEPPLEIIMNNDHVENIETNIDKNNSYWKFINTPLINVDFDELLNLNSDTVGWLQVNGTNINYPIVQTNNNSFYLNHSFDKKYNDAGWLFVDYRNNLSEDKNLIIYGHARLNETMFGTLKNVVKYNWYNNDNNHLIRLSMINSNTSWQVFSTYIIDEEEYYIKTKFNDNNEYLTFLNVLKDRSVYDYNVPLNDYDKILTLSTCYTNNRRVVLHAKLIKYEEKV